MKYEIIIVALWSKLLTMTKTKTSLQFILGGIMLVSVATIGCNNSSDAKTETTTDTTTTKKMVEETAPAAKKDSTSTLTDDTSKRPIVPTNQPAHQ